MRCRICCGDWFWQASSGLSRQSWSSISERVLELAGQDANVMRLAAPYYFNFAFAMLPIIWFGVLRSFAAAMMRTGFVMAITVAHRGPELRLDAGSGAW